MADKRLEIFGLDGTQLQTISVTDDTTINEILLQFYEDGKGFVSLLHKEQQLQNKMTVSQAGLEDGDELTLLWSQIDYVEIHSLPCDAMFDELLDQHKDPAGGLHVKIPDSTEEIEDCAFQENEDLVEVLMHGQVIEIGVMAFKGCTGLKKMVIPDSVKSIGDFAFVGCSSLTQVVIPESVTRIGHGIFSGCSSLSQVVIPSSVDNIEMNAFAGCSSLTEVVIPESVTSIEANAFARCCSLMHLVIPSSVDNIGKDAFKGCNSLIQVEIPEELFETRHFLGFHDQTQVLVRKKSTRYSALCGVRNFLPSS